MTDKEKGLISSVGIVLSPLGFKKEKKSWLKEEEKLIFAINLQKSQYGYQYYVNIGIFLKSIGVDAQRPEKGQVQLRIEQLCDDDKEVISLFNLENDIDDSRRDEAVRSMLIAKVIPFFEANKTLQLIAGNYKNGLLSKFLLRRELYEMIN